MDCEISDADGLFNRFAPLLQKNASVSHPSHVLTTASVAGLGIGSTGTKNSTPAYSASKAAVIHLTRNLAVELAPRHILCNSIAPGFFPSKMANELMRLSGGQKALEDANPNGRLGRPEDMAALAVFLCSRGAEHINGETVAVDGGKLWARSNL
jgi:NAD(P)-dependent dehydrogenase (short-subunit alcohol dehydrogenase family)